jgi:hypothetical protein
MNFIIPIILIALLLIPGIAISSHYERKRFKDILNHLGELNNKLSLELLIPDIKFTPTEFPSLRGHYHNENFAIFIESTHKNKSLVIEFILNTDNDFHFTFREQTGLDNIGILAGEKDIETGDRIFDKKFYISSNYSEKVISIFSNPELKIEALKFPEIFQKGIITLENNKLQFRHYSPAKTLENSSNMLVLIDWMYKLLKIIHKI